MAIPLPATPLATSTFAGAMQPLRMPELMRYLGDLLARSFCLGSHVQVYKFGLRPVSGPGRSDHNICRGVPREWGLPHEFRGPGASPA